MTPSSYRLISRGVWALVAAFAAAAFIHLSLTATLTSAAPDSCNIFPETVSTEGELNAAFACFGDETDAGTYTITLAQDINLTDSTTAISNTLAGISLEINGAGFTIDGGGVANANVRPIKVMTNTTVVINDLTVTGGFIDSGGLVIANGGAGVQNFGDLTLNSSTIISNTNDQFDGGGLYNYENATLTLNGTTVDDNYAKRNGAGIENRGTLFVNDSQIINNVADNLSGGIGSVDTATIRGSTIANNTAENTGAGIYNNSAFADPDGKMIIMDSAIINNIAKNSNAGGLISDNASEIVIERTTISGNSAPNGDGGAIYIGQTSAKASLENVTISGNSSSGPAVRSAGVLTLTHATVISNTSSTGVFIQSGTAAELHLINSILAGHTLDCDYNGNDYSIENTLIQTNNSCTSAFSSVTPKMLALADNGGVGQTHLPAIDSPVLNAAGTSCAAVDQRNVARAGANCELGAVELSGLSISDASVTEGTGGSTTLDFVISRSDISIPITVTVDTVAGTATSGTDYTALSSQEVTFAASGALTQTLSVVVTTDSTVEADETLTVTMSNAQNASLSDASGLGTIQNDDSATLTLSGPASVNEGDSGTSSYAFTATLSASVQGGFSIPVSTSDGTASAGDDYVALSSSLTFTGTAGEAQSASVTLNGDTLDEGDETFIIDLGSITGTTLDASIAVSGDPLTATIQNDDAAELTISVGTTSISEEDVSIPVTVTLSNSSPNTVTVDYATADSSAAAGEDYVAITGTVEFAPTELTKTFVVSITEDSLDELDEAFNIVLSNATNASLGSPSSASITIIDDDGNPSISFGEATYTVGEADGTLDVIIELSNVSGTTVSAGVASGDGTATGGSDFTAVNETVTFSAGEITKTLSIPISNDSSFENNESFTLDLTSPTNAVVGATASALVTITEDDSPPTVSVADVSAAEGNATDTITFTISLDQIAGINITVGYQTQDGTATAGDDYVAASGSIQIPAGDMSATVAVTVNGDEDEESDETFDLTITSVSIGTIDATVSTGTATLTNDDGSNTIFLPIIVSP